MTHRDAAIEIIKKLRDAGFTALMAGGCVRDMLLGRAAKDYDVATNAHPEEVMKRFSRTIKVGAKFGVVIVLVKNVQVEVATFRTESGYLDGRHPSQVAFADAKEDASRRDFTINGMFYDPIEEKVIDYVGGQKDLERRVIRTIGDADTRFGEDFLRMLRAIRFSMQLGFAIEKATWQAICKTAHDIRRISGERIAMELETLLTHPNRGEGYLKLIESGLAAPIFPKTTAEHTRYGVSVVGHLRKRVDFSLALAAVFAGSDVELAIEECETLKLSTDRYRHIRFLLGHRGVLLDADMPLANLKKLMAKPYFLDLYELQRAIQRAEKKPVSALIKIKKRARSLAGENLTPTPLLNGHELIALGAIPGPQVGELAEELYIEQLSGNLHTPHQAREWVTRWLTARKTAQ
ncbi:MAG: CCA tRNA nucleotidyltransferase [Sedimentisphaerales bacterium]|nr:CCA tRNA nucleotidyltransferase [Sedimentisphaerales bacterium]